MKSTLILIALLSLMTSCASKSEKAMIEQKASESKIQDSKALSGKIERLITESKTLTAEQKAELHKIIDVNKKTAMELNEKSFQYRGVLVKELLSGNVSSKRIKIIKKDIEKIEDEKLKNTFETIEKISKIVSKTPDTQKIKDHLIYSERSL